MMLNLTRKICHLLPVLGLIAFCQSATAQEAKQELMLELNNAQQVESGCRVSFLFHNTLAGTISDVAMEVAIMDKAQMTQDFLLISTGRLTQGKRRILQYDLPDIACADIGTILINDVSDCQINEMTAAQCLDAIRPSSRIDIKLGL